MLYKEVIERRKCTTHTLKEDLRVAEPGRTFSVCFQQTLLKSYSHSHSSRILLFLVLWVQLFQSIAPHLYPIIQCLARLLVIDILYLCLSLGALLLLLTCCQIMQVNLLNGHIDEHRRLCSNFLESFHPNQVSGVFSLTH